MDTQVLGACICVCGSTIAIVGMNMQRWSLLRLEAEAVECDAQEQQALLLGRHEQSGDCVKLNSTSSPVAPHLMARPDGSSAARRGASGSFWWSVSLLVYIGGQLVQLAALAFASQTLVSALSNISLVTNVCVAHSWFGEPFATCPAGAGSTQKAAPAARSNSCPHCCGRVWRMLLGWDLAAMCILGAGSTAVVLFAPVAPDTEYTIDQLKSLFFTPVYFAFFCCSAAAAATTLAWIYCSIGHSALDFDGAHQPPVDGNDRPLSISPNSVEDTSRSVVGAPPASAAASQSVALRRREGLLYAVASAVTGSITITLSKITMLLVRTTIEFEGQQDGSASSANGNQLLAPSAWAFIAGLACSALLNLKVLNDGLARHEATLIVPTMYVLHTVLTITGGELLYQTYLELEWTQGLCFGFGVVVSILGVYILAHAPPDEECVGWQEAQSSDDKASPALDKSVDLPTGLNASDVTYSRVDQTPPRLDPYDDGQLWIEVDEEFEDAELAEVMEDADAAALEHDVKFASDGRSRRRPGSAPRLTTTKSLRTASPEADFNDQSLDTGPLGGDDNGPATDRLMLQVCSDDGDGADRHERNGRGQRGHHRRMRSISSSPRDRTAGLHNTQSHSRDSKQGHSPGRSVRYVLVSKSGQVNPQRPLSSLSRIRPSPGAFDLSLWRWSARVVPSRAGDPIPSTLVAAPTVTRTQADPIESSQLPAAAVAVDGARSGALYSEQDGRRLFGADESNDEPNAGTATSSTEEQQMHEQSFDNR